MVLAGWQVPQDDPEEGPGTLWQQVTGAQRLCRLPGSATMMER